MLSGVPKKRTPVESSSWTVYSRLIFALLFVFRILNALSIKTFFQPDEYFQSLEPAWEIAFGLESGAWITWEWREQLRPAIHPWVFAAIFRVADVLSRAFDAPPSQRAEVLIAAPKVAQAFFAAVMDFYTWQLARKVYGPASSSSIAALALTVCSPWQWHSAVRTFSNSIETSLTVVALELWPWNWFLQPGGADGSTASTRSDGAPIQLSSLFKDRSSKQQHAAHLETNIVASDVSARLFNDQPNLLLSLTAAAMACVLRPTNVIIWATIATMTSLRYANFSKTVMLAQAAAIIGPAVLIANLYIDNLHYGTLTIPVLHFFYFNLYQSMAVFYGVNRPDYYFTEGLPLLLTTALPFSVLGLWDALRPGPDRQQLPGYVERQTRHTLALAVVTTVLAFSLIAHKEMRFVYPLLPILHVLAAKPLASFFPPFPFPKQYNRRVLLLLALAANVFITYYVSQVHQRGVIDVMHHLRHEAEPSAADISDVKNTTIGFLMPCHSTPWRSHLVHPEIKAWALTCEPPVNLSPAERADYIDEADVFYANASAWVQHNMGKGEGKREWPEYVVFFEHLELIVKGLLQGKGYTECWRGFNTHWHDDGRRKGDVIVQCRQ